MDRINGHSTEEHPCPRTGPISGGTLDPSNTIEWLKRYCLQLQHYPGLLVLVVWWITMHGPVLIFIESYNTNLFLEINPDWETNGHAIAGSSAAMAAAAAAASTIFRYTSGQWFKLLACTTVVAALVVLALSVSRYVVAAYVLNALACSLIRLQLCIVQGMVAERLDGAEYASLFAVNTFLSLALQTVLQVC
jgi:hypothetical protein